MEHWSSLVNAKLRCYLKAILCEDWVLSSRKQYMHCIPNKEKTQAWEPRNRSITSDDHLEAVCSCLHTFYSEVCSSQEAHFCPLTQQESHWIIRWTFCLVHTELLVSGDQQERGGVTILTGVTDPDPSEEVRLLLYNEGREKCVWNHMSCSGVSCDSKGIETATMVWEVNGNQGLDNSWKRLWVIPPGKSLRSAEVETQGEGNLEWIGRRQGVSINCSPKVNCKGRGYSSLPSPSPQPPSPK